MFGPALLLHFLLFFTFSLLSTKFLAFEMVDGILRSLTLLVGIYRHHHCSRRNTDLVVVYLYVPFVFEDLDVHLHVYVTTQKFHFSINKNNIPNHQHKSQVDVMWQNIIKYQSYHEMWNNIVCERQSP